MIFALILCVVLCVVYCVLCVVCCVVCCVLCVVLCFVYCVFVYVYVCMCELSNNSLTLLTQELHLSIVEGVKNRYATPFFTALKAYALHPTGVFHALPISRAASLTHSHWAKDMLNFYGQNIFLAETSATCGGLDSLLEPTGTIKKAQELAAQTVG